MRLLVLSSCTAKKSVSVSDPLTFDDLSDPSRRAERMASLKRLAVPATQLYSGMHHVHVVEGVKALRAIHGGPEVALKIVSAGFGLVDESEPLPPYECTFSGRNRAQAASWAKSLGVAAAVAEAVANADLVLWLLGAEYLAAVADIPPARDRQRFLFLVKPSEERRVSATRHTVLPIKADAPARYGAGNVALKGKMFRLFALAASADPSVIDAVRADDTPTSFIGALERGKDLYAAARG